MSASVGTTEIVWGPFRISFPSSPTEDSLSSDEAWQECSRAVERELAAPAPNLIHVERIIRKACEGKASDPETLFSHVLSTEALKEMWQVQKKWVEAGFEECIVETDPEAVAYAVQTGLVHTLAMFRDAKALDGEPLTIRVLNGKVLFKVERQWLELKDFKGRVSYSTQERRFIGWNYVHPDGFIRRDNTRYENLYPIARLNSDVYHRILYQAQGFWRGREDFDEGHEKPFVLQVITTGRPCFPDWWMLRNVDEHTPEHSSARLIGPDGSVYSFGTKMLPPGADRVTQVTNILSTAQTHVSTPDYEESRSSHEKRVTSIALTEERFEAICRYVETAAEGFPFNFATANCARLVTTLMTLAGVEVDVSMTPGEFLAGCLPTLSDVPLIGKPMSNVASAVALVAVPIIDLVSALLRYIVPRCIQRAYSWVVQGVAHLLRIAGAFVTNLIALAVFGAGRTYIPEGTRYQPNRGAEGPLALPTATSLLTWKDLFRPGALMFNHALKLKQWQLAQRGCTTIFTDSQSGLSCIDPAAGVVVS
jgi:hypothetical protein